MTDEMMSLRSLVEKSADADLLREMIAFAAEGLMEIEVATLNRRRARREEPASPGPALPLHDTGNPRSH